MILIGGQVKEKLGSVALWLRDHNIDITVVEVQVFKDNDTDSLMFEPKIIIPTPVSKFIDVGKSAADKTKPWKEDGRKWHYENRCSAKSKLILDNLIKSISVIPDIDGPNWSQQYYISYKKDGRNTITLHTNPGQIEIHLPFVDFVNDRDELSKRLGLKIYDTEGSLNMSEKLALPSSIAFYSDQINIRCKDEFNNFDALVQFLTEYIEKIV